MDTTVKFSGDADWEGWAFAFQNVWETTAKWLARLIIRSKHYTATLGPK